MRKIGISLFLLVCAFSASFAEDSTLYADPKGISPEVKKKVNTAKDRLVVELSLMNALIKKDNGVTVPNDFKVSAFSRGINVYFMYDVLLGKKTNYRHFSIAPGIGVGSENYYFKSYKMTWRGDSLTRFVPLGDSISSKKSKMNMTYIDIPLEFRYRSKPNKKTGMSWKLAAGFKLGFLVGSKWKYKGESLDNSGENVTFKDMKIGNMSKIRYGAYIRGGYGMVNLFYYYNISNTFANNKGPKMNTMAFGISINGL